MTNEFQTPSFSAATSELIATLREHGMPSARNLLVTIFGDALMHRRIPVPVQVVAALVEPLGVNERLVRTSLTRLVREGILTNTRIGRRSVYSIAASADTLFDRSDDRIYKHREPEWDGQWTIAVIDSTAATAGQRSTLRRELGWLGMGVIAPNVLAAANLEPQMVTSALDRLKGDYRVLVTRGTLLTSASAMTDEEIARRTAPVDELSNRYRQVIEWFQPVRVALSNTKRPEPRDCWAARLVLIAVFRRVALTDPGLPQQLLPDPWTGTEARALVASLYRDLFEESCVWLGQIDSDLAASPRSTDRSHRFR